MLPLLGGSAYPVVPRGLGGRFAKLESVATGADGFYATDLLCRCVTLFAPNGTVIAVFGQETLVRPGPIGVDGNERVFVVDRGDNTIKVFSGGRQTASFTGNQLGVLEIADLAVDEGALAVADGVGAKVVLVRVLGRATGAGRREMSAPAASGLGAAAGLLALLLFTGCASSGERAVLRLGIEDAPEGKNLLWPDPPDVPRYQYAGELTGEQNFRRPGEQTRKGVRGFLRWLVGMDGSSVKPVVLQRPQAGVVDSRGRIFVTDASRQAVFVFDEQAGELQVWDRAAGTVRLPLARSGVALGRRRADSGRRRRTRPGRASRCEGRAARQHRQRHAAAADRAGARRPSAVCCSSPIRVPTTSRSSPTTALWSARSAGAASATASSTARRTSRSPPRRAVRHRQSEQPHPGLRTPTGRVPITTFGRAGCIVGNLVRPKGVAADGEGNVYVVEGYYDSLLVFSAEASSCMPIGGTGSATGSFYLPAGVWVDTNNRVFVADMFNGRVVIFQFLGGG